MRTIIQIGAIAALSLATIAGAGYAWKRGQLRRSPGPPVSAEDADKIRGACSRCHGFPAPETASKGTWTKILPTMYKLAATDPELPSRAAVLAYFVDQAPDALTLPRSVARHGPGSFGAKRRMIPAPPGVAAPGVASIRPLGPGVGAAGEVIVADLEREQVVLQDIADPGAPELSLAKIPSPVHTQVTDLDGDGLDDLLVASIGELDPCDTDRGKVVWLRGTLKGEYEPITIAEKLGRVAQAEAADMDGDGDKDIVVAEFGYRDTGKVLVLRSSGGASPSFQPVIIDPRPGAVGLAIRDLDGDGALDIVAALAQEHETIMAYLNKGSLDLEFERRVVFKAPHPAWGTSAIEVADMDGDGDLDVLSVNGDSLDAFELKPYHGVYLSENEGHYPFKTSLLAPMPGAYRVRSGDLDADGDRDVVAVAFVPPPSIPPATRGEVRPDSVIWLEQTANRAFEPRSLETGVMNHVDVALLDADDDGDLDILAGELLMVEKDAKLHREYPHWMTLFENAAR